VSHLPRISGREFVKAMLNLGYELDRQRGSHMILRQKMPPFHRLTVPDHRELPTGTLRSLIREAGITVEAFKALL
jgi:predicted RNA binding protein YcfA (HicA-like mRNA interferase family)